MAIAAQGLTFTWGESTLQEIQDLELESAIVTNQGRASYGGFSSGSLRLRGFSITNLPQTEIGRWRLMTITVRTSPTTVLKLWDGWARYDQCVVTATRNDAVLFAFQFTLWTAFVGSGTVVSG